MVFMRANHVVVELMCPKSHGTKTVENLEMVEPHTSHELTFIIPPEVDNFVIGYCLDVESDKMVYNS